MGDVLITLARRRGNQELEIILIENAYAWGSPVLVCLGLVRNFIPTNTDVMFASKDFSYE